MRRRASTATMFKGNYEQRTFEGASSSSTGELLKSQEGIVSSQHRPTFGQRIRRKPRLPIAICALTILVILGVGLGLGLGLHHRNQETQPRPGVKTAPGVVNLGYARYQGQVVDGGVSQWLGIRYAASPVGALRFAAPQPPPQIDTLQQANQVSLADVIRNAPSSNIVFAARPSMPRNP